MAVSCSEHRKVMQSNDPELKLEKAQEYYREDKFMKAVPLLEELLTLYRGTNKAEEVYYYYAYCYFGMEDFIMASHYFNQFTRTYPNSEKARECAFMSAYCDYRNSPQWSLDQSETRKAISKLQLFLNKYPDSPKRDSCHTLIDQLRGKLEKKAFEKARLFYHTEHYRAAIESFENALQEYPDMPYKEEAFFLQLKSHYKLAINSVQEKKKKRLEEAIASYRKFAAHYGESDRMEEAKDILEKTRNTLEELEQQNRENS